MACYSWCQIVRLGRRRAYNLAACQGAVAYDALKFRSTEITKFFNVLCRHIDIQFCFSMDLKNYLRDGSYLNIHIFAEFSFPIANPPSSTRQSQSVRGAETFVSGVWRVAAGPRAPLSTPSAPSPGITIPTFMVIVFWNTSPRTVNRNNPFTLIFPYLKIYSKKFNFLRRVNLLKFYTFNDPNLTTTSQQTPNWKILKCDVMCKCERINIKLLSHLNNRTSFCLSQEFLSLLIRKNVLKATIRHDIKAFLSHTSLKRIVNKRYPHETTSSLCQ